jgi:hypothetical protein
LFCYFEAEIEDLSSKFCSEIMCPNSQAEARNNRQSKEITNETGRLEATQADTLSPEGDASSHQFNSRSSAVGLRPVYMPSTSKRFDFLVKDGKAPVKSKSEDWISVSLSELDIRDGEIVHLPSRFSLFGTSNWGNSTKGK